MFQVKSGTKEFPRLKEWPKMGKNYLDAWYDVCVGKKQFKREEISGSLKDYAQTNQTILSSSEAEE